MRRLFTLKPELRTDKPNTRGLCPVVLVLHIHKVRRRFPLYRYLLPAQWDGTVGRPKRSYPGYAVLCTYLAAQEQKAGDLLNTMFDAGTVGVTEATEALKNALLPEGAKEVEAPGLAADVHAYMDMLMADDVFTRKWSAGTLKARKSNVRMLHKYLPAPMPFDAVSSRVLTALTDRLCSEQGQSPQTANNMTRPLRLAFSHAFQRGVTTHNPFALWDKPKALDLGKRVPLTLKQCDAISKITKDTDPYIAATAAYFLLECYSGLRQSDWNSWTVEDTGAKKYLRLAATQKTGEPIRLLLDNSPRLSAIVALIGERFPQYAYTQQAANRALKVIAGKAKLTCKLTTHVGRHTAATLLDDTGFSEAEIADVLGVTVAVVRGYITPNRSKANRAFEKKGGI